MDNNDTIIETSEGTVKIVRYNRPKRKNAINLKMYRKLTEILNGAAEDTDIAVMVLTGTGDYYSSGNDLSAVLEQGRDSSSLEILKNFIQAFITFPKILIAIVNGPAIGIAATTLALCDLVFASESAFFYTPFSKLGIVAEGCSTLTFPRLIGERRAFFYTPFSKLGIVAEGCSTLTFPRLIGERRAAELLLYSQKMSAKEALACGFVNYIYKPEEIQSKVWDKIFEVSQLSPQSLTITKSLMRRNYRDDLIKTNELEIKHLQEMWASETYTDNIRDFVRAKKTNQSKL